MFFQAPFHSSKFFQLSWVLKSFLPGIRLKILESWFWIKLDTKDRCCWDAKSATGRKFEMSSNTVFFRTFGLPITGEPSDILARFDEGLFGTKSEAWNGTHNFENEPRLYFIDSKIVLPIKIRKICIKQQNANIH